MLASLPSFWKISRSFIEGRFKKVSIPFYWSDNSYFYVPFVVPRSRRDYCSHTLLFQTSSQSRRSPTQCRTMALDIVKLYISLISQFFNLSDMAVMASGTGTSNAAPAHLPKTSHSLCTAHYLLKILAELQETVNEVNGMDISNEVASLLKSLLESARWRFEDILVNCWLRGKIGFLQGFRHSSADMVLTALQMPRSSTMSSHGP